MSAEPLGGLREAVRVSCTRQVYSRLVEFDSPVLQTKTRLGIRHALEAAEGVDNDTVRVLTSHEAVDSLRWPWRHRLVDLINEDAVRLRVTDSNDVLTAWSFDATTPWKANFDEITRTLVVAEMRQGDQIWDSAEPVETAICGYTHANKWLLDTWGTDVHEVFQRAADLSPLRSGAGLPVTVLAVWAAAQHTDGTVADARTIVEQLARPDHAPVEEIVQRLRKEELVVRNDSLTATISVPAPNDLIAYSPRIAESARK